MFSMNLILNNIDLIVEVFCNAEICCSICYQRVNTDVANTQQWACQAAVV